MNKQQLIKKVARRSGVTEDVVDSILNHTLDEIGMSLLQERRVNLDHFGQFELQTRRHGGQRMKDGVRIWRDEERRELVFKPGKGLREQVYAKARPAKTATVHTLDAEELIALGAAERKDL